jgi:hypothetical protein|tara:strand:- start:2116 stop:3387 length:1272 start_codon:yes stop_codon:yes gene_type:complete
MTWKNILKEDDDEPQIKPDGSVFIPNYGFKNKPFRQDKQPIDRDEEGKILPDELRGKKVGLVNWFKTIKATFQEMLQNTGYMGRRGFQISSAGAKPMTQESGASKQIEILGLQIAQENIETMLEGYVNSITKYRGKGKQYPADLPENFSDEQRSIQGIMGSSGYNRIMDAGLKFSEELMSGIFDTMYLSVRAEYDSPDDEDNPLEDVDENELFEKASNEHIQEIWSAHGNQITTQVRNLINNAGEYLDDVLNEGDKSLFDLDGDGTKDINNTDIKNSIKNTLQQAYSKPEMTELIATFTANVNWAFVIKYVKGQQDMMESEVADQTSYKDLGQDPDFETEMANRPEIKYGEEYGQARRKFEDEYKSDDTYGNEFDWFSILSKESATGMTTNAGFTPAVHNLRFGEKPPCERCNDKTTPCGCDN